MATPATLWPIITVSRTQNSARASYRSYLGKGNNADRFTDRDFVSFSLTQKF